MVCLPATGKGGHVRGMVNRMASMFIRPWVLIYLRKERTYRSRGLIFRIMPGVFHPGLYYSSRFMAGFISRLSLEGKTLLDLGSGSGYLGAVAAARGALVTATDLSEAAAANTRLNMETNGLTAEVIRGDLFDGIGNRCFDIIVVNPPFFMKDPGSDDLLAWHCGSRGGYFARFFSGLRNHLHNCSHTFMVLSEGAPVNLIRGFAEAEGFVLTLRKRKRFLTETQYIFQIEYQQTAIEHGTE